MKCSFNSKCQVTYAICVLTKEYQENQIQIKLVRTNEHEHSDLNSNVKKHVRGSERTEMAQGIHLNHGVAHRKLVCMTKQTTTQRVRKKKIKSLALQLIKKSSRNIKIKMFQQNNE